MTHTGNKHPGKDSAVFTELHRDKHEQVRKNGRKRWRQRKNDYILNRFWAWTFRYPASLSSSMWRWKCMHLLNTDWLIFVPELLDQPFNFTVYCNRAVWYGQNQMYTARMNTGDIHTQEIFDDTYATAQYYLLLQYRYNVAISTGPSGSNTCNSQRPIKHTGPLLAS